jgi:acetyltransferase-like isoleucine patch superfamily enzyme
MMMQTQSGFWLDDTAEIGVRCDIGLGAIIEAHANIGDHCFVGHYTVIRPRVVIAHRSEVRAQCHIAEEATIGAYVKIFQLSNICKWARIEDHVYIGPRVLMSNTRQISHGRDFEPILEGPIIQFGARIASGTILLPGVVIGRNALVGAGSVVTKDIPAEEVWYGNPATFQRRIRDNERLVV